MIKKIATISILLLCLFVTVGCKKIEATPPTVYTYKVISVNSYVHYVTNNFGGILSEQVMYTITYVDDANNVYQFDRFHHTEHGNYKLQLGDEDKFVIEGSNRYLYLTEETFNMLSH